MSDFRHKIDKLLHDLKRDRDELNLKLHLAKQDLKEEWNRLNDKLEHLEDKSRLLARATTESSKEIGAAAKLLGEEIKEGFKRIRKQL